MFDLRFVVGVALGGLCLFAVASVFFCVIALVWFPDLPAGFTC